MSAQTTQPVQTPRIFNGITETPPGILRHRYSQRREGKRSVSWARTKQVATFAEVDKSINWRYVESISRRKCTIHFDKLLNIRRRTPDIYEMDKTTYPELAPTWSRLDREGRWTPFTTKIDNLDKLVFEANLAYRQEMEEKAANQKATEEKKAKRMSNEERVARRIEAERVALENMAAQRATEKKSAPRDTVACPVGMVACPDCTLHNVIGTTFCMVCDRLL